MRVFGAPLVETLQFGAAPRRQRLCANGCASRALRPAGWFFIGCWLSGFWLLTGSSLAAGASAAAGAESRFRRTVGHLQGASVTEQMDFAAIALTFLAQAHAKEAALAREELRSNTSNNKLLGWSASVDQYVRQLLVIREDFLPAFSPDLIMEHDRPLTLRFGDMSVIFVHPRPGQQSAFEQAILLQFCAQHDCEAFAAAGTEREAIPVSSARVRPEWVFSARGPVCSYLGIELQFSHTRQLALLRRICEEFLQEVMLLDTEIAWQRRHAVSIDWDQIKITATPGQQEHMIRLNALGDTILAPVPVIYGSSGLLEEIKPWLRQRRLGETGASLVIKAERYGW